MTDNPLAALLSVMPLVLTFLPVDIVALCMASFINSFGHNERMEGVVSGVLAAIVGVFLFGDWMHDGHIPTEKALATGISLAGLLFLTRLRGRSRGTGQSLGRLGRLSMAGTPPWLAASTVQTGGFTRWWPSGRWVFRCCKHSSKHLLAILVWRVAAESLHPHRLCCLKLPRLAGTHQHECLPKRV